MRLFIAIELPLSVRMALGRVRDRLESCGADVKWVENDNQHLTLKFLGNTHRRQFEPLKGALERSCNACLPMDVQLNGIGAFPRTKAPRVIWCGVRLGKEELQALAGRIESQLLPLGFPQDEREYSPHVTLGRVRSRKNLKKLIPALEQPTSMEIETFQPTKVALFQSELDSHGPRYQILATFPFHTT